MDLVFFPLSLSFSFQLLIYEYCFADAFVIMIFMGSEGREREISDFFFFFEKYIVFFFFSCFVFVLFFFISGIWGSYT